jgi:hypothetical protein
MTTPLDTFTAALETRLMADLTFPEVSRALRALSSAYVERRAKLSQGAALSGAGKRAAFALFYGPLHYLLVNHVVTALGAPFTDVQAVVDLGCGTGLSGAGWASACSPAPRITGIDRNPWAVEEARRTYKALGLSGSARVEDLSRATVGGGAHREARTARATGILLAYAVNELPEDALGTLLERLLDHARDGGRVLIVEPLAGFVAPWWRRWASAFEEVGGRSDEWRFVATVPPIVEKLGRAAGLNHREIKGRSISISRT